MLIGYDTETVLELVLVLLSETLTVVDAVPAACACRTARRT